MSRPYAVSRRMFMGSGVLAGLPVSRNASAALLGVSRNASAALLGVSRNASAALLGVSRNASAALLGVSRNASAALLGGGAWVSMSSSWGARFVRDRLGEIGRDLPAAPFKPSPATWADNAITLAWLGPRRS